jgi:peptidoglycan-associated lipoprotein
VIIAGFTDERGTPEYNRGLGERRALAVREALLRAGVDAALLQTVSFGEEMPEDPSSGEAAWARNRRAEFGVVRR